MLENEVIAAVHFILRVPHVGHEELRSISLSRRDGVLAFFTWINFNSIAFCIVVLDVYDGDNQMKRMTTSRIPAWYQNPKKHLILAAQFSNSMEAATDRQGHVFYNWWNLGQGAHGWRVLDGRNTNASPATALVSSEYLFVVIKGVDSGLYLNQGEVAKPFIEFRSEDPEGILESLVGNSVRDFCRPQPCRALSISGQLVVRLLNARGECGVADRKWIDSVSREETKLLRRAHRYWRLAIGDPVGRYDPKQSRMRLLKPWTLCGRHLPASWYRFCWLCLLRLF